MKMKKEYIILAVIIIALSVYLIMRRSDRTLYELPKIPEVAQKKITRLQITKGNTVIDLDKKDNAWYIEPKQYPADKDKVKNMLDDLGKLTLTALVSESKNYSLYDLSPATRITVKAWQGDSLKRDIDVGKTASSYRHTFVKTAGDDRVFHARGNLRNTFDYSVDDLRDKTVLAVTSADIRQIQVAKEQQSVVLNKTQPPEKKESPPAAKKENALPASPKTVWRAPDGRAGDSTAVDRILNTVSNLRCNKFIDDRAKADFASPLLSIQLKGTKDYTLSVFAKTAEKNTAYPATSSGSDYAFLLSDSRVKSLMEDASKILQEPEKAAAGTEKKKPDAKQQKK